jgi:hypothetical protein
MALVHQATLTPSKLELLAAWLPTRPWFRQTGELERVGSYRFDDPDGKVGIEIMLVSSGQTTFQIPLTYRGEPIAAGDQHLIGTMNHSVLGERWIYDGCADSVAVSAMLTATLKGTSEALVEVEVEGQLVTLPQVVSVHGNGSAETSVVPFSLLSSDDDGGITTVTTDPYRMHVARVVGTAVTGRFTLTGSWSEQSVELLGITIL